MPDRSTTIRTFDYRAYLRKHGLVRNPWSRGNGLEKHVDLQVLGVWRDWAIKEGRVELPDVDGRNDGRAAEHARVLEFDVPAGRHRVRVSSTGGDWATVDWYCFEGRLGD